MFTTRPWRPDDEPFLWDMLHASIHLRDGEAPPPRSILDEPGLAHYLQRFGSLDGDDAEVADNEHGERIGAAFCRRLPAADRGYGFVSDRIPEVGMAVVDGARGRGIGTALLVALLGRHPTMSLSVDRENSGAHALYLRLGFVEVDDDGRSLTMLHRGEPPAHVMTLVRPDDAHLPGYVDALRQGWSPNTMRPEAAAETLEQIERDADAFLSTMDDPDGVGPPVRIGDMAVPRLPGFHRWMWDGEFCGSISARWSPGTAALPPHVLGHIGYTVVPWKRRLGYATRALSLLLDELRESPPPTMTFAHVEVTTDVSNESSQRVIQANGGVLVERFEQPAIYGPGEPKLRFRIAMR